MKPPPKLTVSGWADENRELSPESSAEPGQWRTDRAEYQREMMDATVDPMIEIETIMSSAQVGKTSVVENIIGFHVKHDPSPILLIQPTLEMARSFSKDRLMPMLRDTVCLRGFVQDARAKDSTNEVLHKTFPGGHITMAGANSPVSLGGRPIRIVIFDEVDRYPPSAGSEGDPVKLGMKRTKTFWNRKIILTSTPSVKDVSRIEFSWQQSDQRHFFVPCPKCKEKQVLLFSPASTFWKVLKNGRSDRGFLKFDAENGSWAFYSCENCGTEIGEDERDEMVSRGAWKTMRSEVERHAGFHINELYSPWSSWMEIVTDHLEAKKRTETLRVWVNTTAGEVWEEEESYTISHDALVKRVEDYVRVPSGGVVLSCGIDVQDDRLEVVVKAWGKADESWLVEYKTLYGSPGHSSVWALLDDFLGREWIHESGVKLRIAATCIDSGGHFTQNVYAYVKRRGSSARRTFAVKGMAGGGRPVVGRPSRNNRQRVALFPIGVDTVKELVYSRLAIEEDGAGKMHFNSFADEEYLSQLTAEKQVVKFSRDNFPTRVWRKIRPRNEALDCETYALAAFTLLNANIDRIAEAMKKSAKEVKKDERKPEEERRRPLAAPRMKGRRRGWVHNW